MTITLQVRIILTSELDECKRNWSTSYSRTLTIGDRSHGSNEKRNSNRPVRNISIRG